MATIGTLPRFGTRRVRDDQEGDVCSNQARFNSAIEEALDEYKGTVSDGALAVTAILYLVFLTWALYLAVMSARKNPGAPSAQLNTMFAVIAPPLYVIVHYLNAL